MSVRVTGWRGLPALKPVRRRLRRLQRVYWTYFRPLFCEVIPTPSAARVLVVCPHIDDDVIGCGGVLRQHAAAGAAVTSVYLRDGGPSREIEAREAARLIGIDELLFLRWGPPPTSTPRWRTVPGTRAEVELGERAVAALRETIEHVRPDVVYSPFFLDAHPDHAAATELLGRVLERGAPVETCFLYEVWSPLVPNVLVDITAEAEVKRRAIDAHRSQVETIDMSAGILGLNAYRARMNRVHGYAEAFLRVGPNELIAMLADTRGQGRRNGDG